MILNSTGGWFWWVFFTLNTDFIFWKHEDSDRWCVFGNPRFSWHHPHLCAAHVEGVGIYTVKHHHCSGVLGRLMDELCVPEHGSVTMQKLWLGFGFTTRAASLQGSDLRVYCCQRSGHRAHSGWSSMHFFLWLWPTDQIQCRHCRRCGVYYSRDRVYYSCHLVSLQHHHRVL